MTRFLPIALLLLAGCAAQLPPLPEDAVAKRFELLPDKAVIYLARPVVDQRWTAPVALDDQMIGSTYQGTYMRIEVPAGTHQLRGIAGDNGSIKFTTKPGALYFVQHTAYGTLSFVSSNFQLVDSSSGRSLVMGGQLTALITQ